MGVFLRAKFEASSIILTSFRQWVILPLPPPQNEHLKNPPRLGLIAGDSMINGINEKRISTDFKSVKVRCFRGATTDDMYFNLIPLLGKKPAALDLHVETNNLSNETSFQIYDKLLNLVHFVKENNLNCHVVLSSPIDRLDDGRG